MSTVVGRNITTLRAELNFVNGSRKVTVTSYYKSNCYCNIVTGKELLPNTASCRLVQQIHNISKQWSLVFRDDICHTSIR